MGFFFTEICRFNFRVHIFFRAACAGNFGKFVANLGSKRSCLIGSYQKAIPDLVDKNTSLYGVKDSKIM